MAFNSRGEHPNAPRGTRPAWLERYACRRVTGTEGGTYCAALETTSGQQETIGEFDTIPAALAAARAAHFAAELAGA